MVNIVEEIREQFIELLENVDFFKDYEITDLSYSKEIIDNYLNEKLIKGELDYDNGFMDEKEFDDLTNKILIQKTLNEMVKDGTIGVIDNDNNINDNLYFLKNKKNEE